uniref:SufD family Fe-S cluster assembly protein n=1 Tax=Salmonella enterica TaxID=28901 RepID=UPI00398C71F0
NNVGLNSLLVRTTTERAKGMAVFDGMTTVSQHAIKTDGQMTNTNLLWEKLAEVDTKPQLEIYADDVKCSNGATIGRIDDERMFDRPSRGIRHQEARHMILYAFAAELSETKQNVAQKQNVRGPNGQHVT